MLRRVPGQNKKKQDMEDEDDQDLSDLEPVGCIVPTTGPTTPLAQPLVSNAVPTPADAQTLR